MTLPSSILVPALRRFRAALAAAEAAPSEEAVAALRRAALPLMDEAHATYVAAGTPYGGDRSGLFRWLAEIIAQPDAGADGPPVTAGA